MPTNWGVSGGRQHGGEGAGLENGGGRGSEDEGIGRSVEEGRREDLYNSICPHMIFIQGFCMILYMILCGFI